MSTALLKKENLHIQADKSFFGPSLPSQKLTMRASRQRQAAGTRAAKDFTVGLM